MTYNEARQEEEGQEEYSSRVALKFFRHDEKEKTQPGQKDQDVALTEKGRKHAKSLSKDGDISQSVAFGSGFRRAGETVGHIMTDESLTLTGDETLEELKAVVDAGRKYGTKIGADTRLGFMLDNENAYGKEALAYFKKGEWLKFLVEKSDKLAEEVGDTKSSTYSRMAANVAEITDKYLTIAPRFDKLVEEKGYEKEMSRFFGSHQGVLESFLAKVIEKTRGKGELDRFVSTLKNQGFDFSEGFEIDIENQQNNPVIKLSYKHEGKTPEDSFEYKETINLDLLKEIIKEGEGK